MIYRDRVEAGQRLAERLEFFKGRDGLVVFGIPRGGVVVAAEIARSLHAPLKVLLARKVGVPFNPELAIGAVASTGQVVLDALLIEQLGLTQTEVEEGINAQREEISRRVSRFGVEPSTTDVSGKTVIVADDGVATGSTMLAGLRALRSSHPVFLVMAVPVGPPEVIAILARECDQAVVLETPVPFWAVGRFYQDFSQTDDETVVRLLAESRVNATLPG